MQIVVLIKIQDLPVQFSPILNDPVIKIDNINIIIVLCDLLISSHFFLYFSFIKNKNFHENYIVTITSTTSVRDFMGRLKNVKKKV